MLLPSTDPDEEQPIKPLSEDNQPSFSEAAPLLDAARGPVDSQGQPAKLDDTHPVTDTGIEGEEAYEQGSAEAAGASEPNAGNAVTDYNPPRTDTNR